MRIIRSSVLTPDQINALDGATVLDPDSLDSALVGIAPGPDGICAVYNYDLLIQATAREMEGEYEHNLEGAQEWVEYNTLRGIPYMGARAPLVVSEFDPDCEDEDSTYWHSDPTGHLQGQRFLIVS